MRDLRRCCAFLLGGLILTTAAPAFAVDTLKPGQWEVTTQGVIDRDGQKTPIPPSKMEMCMSADQAKEALEATVPADSGCTVETVSKAKGKLVTRVTCGPLILDNTMTWTAKAYDTQGHAVTKSNGKTEITDMTAKGRYLGACKP